MFESGEAIAMKYTFFPADAGLGAVYLALQISPENAPGGLMHDSHKQ
jgi:hypothetical protein